MITGNETPLVVGAQRDLTCTASNIDVATIEWIYVLQFFPFSEISFADASNVDELILELTPPQTGQYLFKCVVVGTDGQTCSVDVPLTFEGRQTIAGVVGTF